MNQSSNLQEHLSPRPIVCPLIHLGRNSPSPEQSSSSTDPYHSEQNYNFHSQYMDIYDTSNSNNTYLQKSTVSNYQYYQTQNLNNDSRSTTNPITVGYKVNTYHKQNSQDLSSLSLGTNYWGHENHKNVDTKHSDIKYFNQNQNNETNYLLDNFTKLGKSSPNLDQGYHTLVSPSPCSTTPNLWFDGNGHKVKKYIKNNSFDRLSDELLIKIFSFLPSYDLSICARVCRRFDVLVWTPTLWRFIQLVGEHISGDLAVRGVLRQLCGQGRTGACPSIERVYLTDGAKITDRGLLLLAKRCPELNHLKIQGSSSVTNNAIFEVATRCVNLQHLDATGKYNLYNIYV